MLTFRNVTKKIGHNDLSSVKKKIEQYRTNNDVQSQKLKPRWAKSERPLTNLFNLTHSQNFLHAPYPIILYFILQQMINSLLVIDMLNFLLIRYHKSSRYLGVMLLNLEKILWHIDLNISCGYWLKSPQWGDSNQYPLVIFLWRMLKSFLFLLSIFMYQHIR